MAKIVYTRFIPCSKSTTGTISLLQHEIEKHRRELSAVIQRARQKSALGIMRRMQRSRANHELSMSQERTYLAKRAQDTLESEQKRLVDHFVHRGTQTLQHALNSVIAETPLISETFVRESLKQVLSQLTHTKDLSVELNDRYQSSAPINGILEEAHVQCFFHTEIPVTRMKIKTPLGIIESDLLSNASQIIADHPLSRADLEIVHNNHHDEKKLKNAA